MAYLATFSINYKTDGYYVLMTFEAEGSVVKELDRVAGLSTEVLRVVTYNFFKRDISKRFGNRYAVLGMLYHYFKVRLVFKG